MFISLDETGKTFTSIEFSNLIFNNQLTADLGVSDKIKDNYSVDSSGYMIDGKQLYLNKNKPNWIK